MIPNLLDLGERTPDSIHFAGDFPLDPNPLCTRPEGFRAYNRITHQSLLEGSNSSHRHREAGPRSWGFEPKEARGAGAECTTRWGREGKEES
jgi:hypothetical protein